MSAEIPWACGPGEALTPAPPLVRSPDPEDARTDADALADLEVNELRYTQAQWDGLDASLDAAARRLGEVVMERDAARGENARAVRALTEERDRALVRAQKAEDSARFWEAEAKAWEADWRGLGEAVTRGRPRTKDEGR